MFAGNWFVCPDCVGRRSPAMTICDSFVDKGLPTTTGARGKTRSSPFKRRMCIALESVELREAVIDEYTHRRDPVYVRKDIFDVCPWMVEIRRASTPELRSPLLPNCVVPFARTA